MYLIAGHKVNDAGMLPAYLIYYIIWSSTYKDRTTLFKTCINTRYDLWTATKNFMSLIMNWPKDDFQKSKRQWIYNFVLLCKAAWTLC